MTLDLDSYILHIQHENDIFAKAQLLDTLIKQHHVPIKDIALRLKLSSSYVCNVVRILKLPDLVRDGYYSGLVTPTHLFIIARLHTEKDCIDMYEMVLQQNMSTSALEEHVRSVLYNVSSEGRHVSDVTKNVLTTALQRLDGRLKVKIIQSRIRAKIVIEMPGGLVESSQVIEKLAEKLGKE